MGTLVIGGIGEPVTVLGLLGPVLPESAKKLTQKILRSNHQKSSQYPPLGGLGGSTLGGHLSYRGYWGTSDRFGSFGTSTTRISHKIDPKNFMVKSPKKLTIPPHWEGLEVPH